MSFNVCRLPATGAAAISIASVLVVAGSPANAAMYTVTYEGIVRRWQGQTNVFGITEEFPRNGPSYALVYTFDTNLGSHTIDDQPDRQLYQDNHGGEWGQNPIVSAKVTINGVTEVISRAEFPSFYNIGYHYVSDGPEHESAKRLQTFLYGFSSDADLEAGRSYSSVRVIGYLFTEEHPPHGTELPFEGTPNSQGGFVDFSWSRWQFPYQAPDRSIDFGGTVARVTTAAVVPEPTAWALMILGLGGVGAVLRKTRYRPSPG